MFSNLDENVRSWIMLHWCAPQEYIAMLCCGKLCEEMMFLRSAARFALTRLHLRQCNGTLCMQDWHGVWSQCRDVFCRNVWPLAAWIDACVFPARGCAFVAHSTFVEALDAMLATREPCEHVSSVLAMTVSTYPYEIHALLMLRSGSFAFVGAMESTDAEPGTSDETRVALCCNVVIGTTLVALENAAVDRIDSLDVCEMEAMLMPWHVDQDGKLNIYFYDVSNQYTQG